MDERGHGDFDHLGFEPAYELEIDPEFPGSGSWDRPVHGFDLDGQRVDEFVARWGAPRVLVVTPHHAAPWVGFWPHGGLGGLSGEFPMPNPTELCVAVGGAAFIVDVEKPELGARVASVWAQQIVACRDPALLLLCTPVDITAFDADGLAWESPRLVMDDLHIIGIDGDRINVTGNGFAHSTEHFEVDLHRGMRLVDAPDADA